MKIINFKNKKVVDSYFKMPLAAVYICFPALLKLFRDIRGKAVLDVGCGSGWLSHKLSEKGATVFGADNSPEWIRICKQHYTESKRLKFFLTGCDNLRIFKDSKFDVIIANMLFLSVPSRKTVERAFREIGRVIKKNGVFFFSDIHPFAIISPKTNTKVGGVPLHFSNFKEGSKCRSKYLLADYTPLEFVDAHWSLGFYSALLKKNGMAIEEILEPKPVKMDPKNRLKDYRIPDYIIFKCKKT